VSAVTKEDACIRIELTNEQRKQIKDASGDDVKAIEFSVQELEVAAIELPVKDLEQRIAPSLVANHNETLLAEPFPF
jgi:hypothetical protein